MLSIQWIVVLYPKCEKGVVNHIDSFVVCDEVFFQQATDSSGNDTGGLKVMFLDKRLAGDGFCSSFNSYGDEDFPLLFGNSIQ